MPKHTHTDTYWNTQTADTHNCTPTHTSTPTHMPRETRRSRPQEGHAMAGSKS